MRPATPVLGDARAGAPARSSGLIRAAAAATWSTTGYHPRACLGVRWSGGGPDPCPPGTDCVSMSPPSRGEGGDIDSSPEAENLYDRAVRSMRRPAMFTLRLSALATRLALFPTRLAALLALFPRGFPTRLALFPAALRCHLISPAIGPCSAQGHHAPCADSIISKFHALRRTDECDEAFAMRNDPVFPRALIRGRSCRATNRNQSVT